MKKLSFSALLNIDDINKATDNNTADSAATNKDSNTTRKDNKHNAKTKNKTHDVFDKIYLGNLNAEQIAELIVRGGWPGVIALSTAKAKKTAQEYISILCETDISSIDGTTRDPQKVRAVFFSLARNESSYATINTITKDVASTITRQTVAQYLSLFKRLYICNDTPAWNPALRSPIKIRAASNTIWQMCL